jgi:hypothetical protein
MSFRNHSADRARAHLPHVGELIDSWSRLECWSVIGGTRAEMQTSSKSHITMLCFMAILQSSLDHIIHEAYGLFEVD